MPSSRDSGGCSPVPRCLLWPLAALVAAFFALYGFVRPAPIEAQAGQTPAEIGQWSPTIDLPMVGVHLVLMPTGKVFMMSAESQVAGRGALIWDPASPNTFSDKVSPSANQFCSGHTLLADGRILITGGDLGQGEGIFDSEIFNPFTETWTDSAEMTLARWYPTATELADGRVLVMGGTNAARQIVNIQEVYNPAADSWTRLPTSANMGYRYYPLNYLLPDGRLLVAGSYSDMEPTRVLNLATNLWATIDSTLRQTGSSVMYLPGKILNAGSRAYQGAGVASLTAARVLDMTAGTPSWQATGSMRFARAYHTLTTLPDGQVLVTGGTSNGAKSDLAADVHEAEMWSPGNGQWTTLARAAVPQGYHSAAVLLFDGRVFVTGQGRSNGPNDADANDQKSAEIYSPPYLFKGARPVITSVSPTPTIHYGATFSISTPDASDISKVSLISLPAVTHGFNENQHFWPQVPVQIPGGLSVQAPSDANLAPPGYYMLFIINQAGVPSVASLVRIPAVGEDTEAPSSPSLLQATAQAGSVRLDWVGSTDDVGVTAYNVHRSAIDGFTPGASNKISQTNGANAYVDAALPNDGTFYYRVTAQDAKGNVSAASNQAFVAALPVTLPNLVDQTQANASATITGLGLSVGAVTTGSSATIAAGRVISHNPAAGEIVPVGSAVALLVSTGLPTVAPAITSANNTSFTVGVAGTFTVTATGTPAPTFSRSGTLPGGVAFSAAGILSGTPAAGTAGTYVLTITAQNGVAPNATQSFTLTVLGGSPPPPPPAVNAAYSLNAGSGVAAADLSGNNNNGTLQNGVAWTAGKYGNGLSFDGSDDFVSVPDAATLDLGTSGTIEAWVRLNAINRWNGIVAKGNANSDPAMNYALEVSNTNRFVCTLGSGSAARILTSTSVAATATFYHVACVWNGTQLQLYINGVLNTSVTQNLTPAANTSALYIGQYGGNVDRISGVIDEVRIYGRALSQAEISADMNAALGPAGPPPSVSGLNPANGMQGSVMSVIVTGSNFQSGTACNLGTGVTVGSCAFNSATQMTANITISAAATVGVRTFTLTNPDGQSASLLNGFTIDPAPPPPPPTLASVSPLSGQQTQVLSVTIAGTGFLGGATCSFGAGITVNSCSVFSSTQIAAGITISGGAATGPRGVTVTNVDGQSATLPSSFTVNAAPPPPAVNAAYSLNAGSGVAAADLSGNNNNGTLQNGVVWTTAGKYGNGLSFDGSDDFVSVPDAATLDLGTSGTIEAWVRLNAINRWNGIVAKGNANSDPAMNYALEVSNTNRFVCTLGSGSAARILTSTSVAATATFYHVACVWNGTQLQLYINGVLNTSVTQNLTPAANTSALYIGQYGGNVDRISGVIDEVRIYGRALSQPEISTDMNTPIAP